MSAFRWPLVFAAHLPLAGCVAIAGNGMAPVVAMALCALTVTLWPAARAVHAARGDWREKCALAWFAVAMNLCYLLIGHVLAQATERRHDDALAAIDASLGAAHIDTALRALLPGAGDWLHAAYLGFLPLLFFSLASTMFAPIDVQRRFARGLYTVYGLGFIGYVLVPAAGPVAAGHAEWLHGGFLSALDLRVLLEGSNHVDAFPSLHVAVSGFLLLHAIDNRQYRAVPYALLVPLIWLSTLYLGIHYLVDVLVGAVLACAGAYVARQRTNLPVEI